MTIGTVKRIRVLLVDDHPSFREGLRILLSQTQQIEIVGEAGNALAALEQIAALLPDVVLLDCELPDLEGASVVESVRKRGIKSKFLALSAFDDLEHIRSQVGVGVNGYLLKNEPTATIVTAIERVAQGKSFYSSTVAQKLAEIVAEPEPIHLTEREKDVLKLLAEGLGNAEIGRQLHVTERTVAYHVENLLSKLGAENRTKLVVEAIRRGWIKV